MLRSKQKQKGLSPIGVLFMVCTFAFVLLLFFKLSPFYMDYWTLRTVFSDVGAIPNVTKQPNSEITKILAKRLIINSFRDFSAQRDSYIERDGGVLTMGFEYEVREHMIGNIDVVLSFSHAVELDVE